MIEYAEPEQGQVRVKVVGVGNAGGMIVKRIARERLPGVECGAVNTALKDLGNYAEVRHLQIGAELTRGHGAGMDPQVGRKAALEDANRIRDFLGQNDLVFLVAGFGKGTGTGATPVVAELARDLGALTVALVTTPFDWEKRRHQDIAQDGLKELKERVDAYVPLSNQRLCSVPSLVTTDQLFAFMDDTILSAVRGLVDVMLRPGRMSYDLADLRTLLKGAGLCAFSLGTGKGEGRVGAAARELAGSPFMRAGQLSASRSLVASIGGGPDLTYREVEDIAAEIERIVGGEPTLAPALYQDEALLGELRVMLFAAGVAPSETAREPFELFAERDPALRGEPGGFYRPSRSASRPARPAGEREPATGTERNVELPAYLRLGRNGPVNGPRG